MIRTRAKKICEQGYSGMNAFVSNKVDYGYNSLSDAFPAIEAGVDPLGSRVLVQLRSPKSKTAGGIILIDEVKETDAANTQVAIIRAVGPIAFRNRNTGEQWKEGAWAKPGDFVRVPKYGGDRWNAKFVDAGDEREITFVIFNDLDLIGRVSDPLAMRAFI